MTDDFSKYEQMKVSGATADDVYRQAIRDNIDPIARIRLIRAVYSLTPKEAKEVTIRAQGWAESLDQHQEEIAKAVFHEQKVIHVRQR